MSPKLHRALLPRDGVARLAGLIDEAVRADPRSKSSIGVLYGDPASRPMAEGVIGWFWASPLPALYRSIVGQEPGLLIDFTTVRRHTPGVGGTRVSWHTDANFVGPSGTMRVLWVPVDPVGVDAPGLEFAFPTAPILRKTVEDYLLQSQRNPGHTLTDAELLAMLGGAYRSWRPILEPGDVLSFDQWGVHRTDPRLDRAARTAIEFRMYSLEDPPRRVALDRRLTACVAVAEGGWRIAPAVDLSRAAPADSGSSR